MKSDKEQIDFRKHQHIVKRCQIAGIALADERGRPKLLEHIRRELDAAELEGFWRPNLRPKKVRSKGGN